MRWPSTWTQSLQAAAVLTVVFLPACDWRPAQPAKTAPVSGTVRMDGEPLENVKVLFVPIDRSENGSRLPTAFAVTDAEGRYTLANTAGENGAVVGRNQVWLSTRSIENIKDEEGNTAEMKETSEEIIPAKYNKSTTLVFEVPVDGTVNADFELQSVAVKESQVESTAGH